MNYFMPTRLYVGPDCLASHGWELPAYGSSCVIVTSGEAARLSGTLDDVEQALTAAGVESCLWDSVTENPPVENCRQAGRFAADHGAEFVIGIGGGSALDAAKAIAVFLANPTLDEDGFYAKAWDRSPAPIILVGTTAGTGSEVTKVAVLTDGSQRKHSIHDDRLYASVSFGDSRYTKSCPTAVALSCGVDVLAHATESFFSRKADEISRAFAVRAIRLAWKPLAATVAGGTLSDEDYRALYEASILGGLAINTTGTCFPHNVGYYLTENYGVPHGFACAVFLPAMLACARESDPAYADAFFAELGAPEESFVTLIESCLPELGIRMDDEEIEAALPRWDNNGSVANTRADVSLETIRETLHGLFVEA